MIKTKDSTEIKLIDFIDKNKELIIEDLKWLVSFNSVYDPTTISEHAPRGINIYNSFNKLNHLLKKRNINTWHFDEDTYEYGYFYVGDTQKENVLFICHIDTVECNEPDQWITKNPLAPKIIDNFLYGRGALDDKGAIVCAIWASLSIKNLGIDLPFELRTFVGGDEETKCTIQKEYVKKENNPTLGIVVDGEFPYAYGEKSMINLQIISNNSNTIVKDIDSTNVNNMVPSFCSVVIDYPYNKIKDDFEKFLKLESLKGFVSKHFSNPNYTCIRINSEPNHAIYASQSRNPIIYMFKFLSKYDSKCSLTLFVNDYLYNDFFGKKLNISRVDPESNEGSNVNLGCTNIDKFNNFSINLNIRFVNFLLTGEKIVKTISDLLKKKFWDNYSIKILQENNGFVIDKQNPMWNEIQNIYTDVTGDNSKPKLISGGTYARHFKNSVCMGPILTHIGDKYNAHCINEKMPLTSLIGAIKFYSILLYRMSKKWDTLVK